MPRNKEYNEQAVIEKAMALFWRNGYETTTVRMLEKEMGINQFSIYSSFGNKQGVFAESIKCYKTKIKSIADKLKDSKNGVTGIKQYFYDFLAFSKENDTCKGCLVTNTVNELGKDADPVLMEQLLKFSDEIKGSFVTNLKQDAGKDAKLIDRQANFLMTSMIGITVASKFYNNKQLKDSIETIFENL